MNQSQDPLMDAAVKAATNAGACCPKAVAEILRDRLYPPVAQKLSHKSNRSRKTGVLGVLASTRQTSP